jgi:hypothetical protein
MSEKKKEKVNQTREAEGKTTELPPAVHNGQTVIPLSGGMNAPRLVPTSAEWNPHMKRFSPTSMPLPKTAESDGNRASLIGDPEGSGGSSLANLQKKSSRSKEKLKKSEKQGEKS